MAEESGILELVEYRSLELPREAVSSEDGEALWKGFQKKIAVDFPTPATDGQWRLTCQGWVGFIRVSDDLAIRLSPKVPLKNLFGMLEVAFRLKPFEFMDDLYDCGSLQEFYDCLAKVLAGRILDRCRKGLYSEYQSREERISYLRGRLDFQKSFRKPWQVRLPCIYDEHTADLEENQLLLWTVRRILRSGLCSDNTRATVRGAYRVLNQIATPVPFRAEECVSRQYNRLNDDYRPMHALCRFFLESSGPQHEHGDRSVMPFLIDMAALFELFVAEWLRENGPDELRFQSQKREYISKGESIYFDLDLLVTNRRTGKPLLVIDTKYKTTDKPSTGDLQQVVAYAEAVGCSEAWLVYPQPVLKGENLMIGQTRVRSVAFDIRGNLDAGGATFLELLVSTVRGDIGFDAAASVA